MKILYVGVITTGWDQFLRLIEEGHEVTLMKWVKDGNAMDLSYYEEQGFNTLTCDEGELTSDDVQEFDYIIAGEYPSSIHEVFDCDATLIGPSWDMMMCEFERLKTKRKAESLGLNVPKILFEGSLDDIVTRADQWTYPLYVKHQKDYRTQIVEKKEDLQYLQQHSEESLYIEEYIPHEFGNEFTYYCIVANGKWDLQFVNCVEGEWVGKRATNEKLNYWVNDIMTYIANEDVMEEGVKHISKFMDWVATHEGSMECHVTMKYDPRTETMYFLEIGCRPEQMYATPCLCTGEEWLQGMQYDPTIITKHYKGKTPYRMYVGGDDYPIDIHERYDVLPPCGLRIDGDRYRMVDGGVQFVQFEPYPQKFIDELRANNLLVRYMEN